MAGNIKGITIEFRGETTSLNKALRKIQSESNKTQRELTSINKALKFNPSSVDLWKQKQQVLNEKIKQTEERQKTLKDALKKMDDSGISHQTEEYRRFQRKLIETESKLKTFKSQLREIGNANLKALSMQLKEVGSKVTSIGKDLTTKVTGPIVAGYTLAAKYASDYEENLNKIDVAFGENSASVKEWANNASESFGLSKVQATGAVSAFGALGKGIGLTESEAAGMATTLTGLSADLASYFNTGTDESAKALEGIFTGETEALKKYGVVMSETNLKQFAADQGLVYSAMSQSEKTALRYQYVLEKTKDAQGDYSRTSDGTANSIKTFQATLQDLATTIGTNLLPIITPIIQKITEWVGKFNELSPQAQKIITIIGLVAAALGPVLVIIGTLISSIGAIAGVLGMVTAPMIGIALIIAALVAAGIKLYQNWDTIKAKASELWTTVTTAFTAMWEGIQSIFTAIGNFFVTIFNFYKTLFTTVWGTIFGIVKAAFIRIKDAIVTPIRTAIDTIKGIIDKVKSWFPISIGKIFSNLKLPHFKLTGSFSLKNMTVPHLSVDWYAQGGIFNAPTIAGIGEIPGGEAVVPLNKFWDKLDKMSTGETNIIININGSDKDPREIAEEVKRVLITETNQRRLAWQ